MTNREFSYPGQEYELDTPRQNAALKRDDNLRQAVRQIVHKYEAGCNHDAGAYSPDCEICRILDELRRALG